MSGFVLILLFKFGFSLGWDLHRSFWIYIYIIYINIKACKLRVTCQYDYVFNNLRSLYVYILCIYYGDIQRRVEIESDSYLDDDLNCLSTEKYFVIIYSRLRWLYQWRSEVVEWCFRVMLSQKRDVRAVISWQNFIFSKIDLCAHIIFRIYAYY